MLTRLVCSTILAALPLTADTWERDRAPAFSITTDQGKHITPTSFGGRLLVLNFWETACVPCVKELPSLSEFARTFPSDGVVVLAVSGDKDHARYRRFLQDHRVELQTYRDPKRQISARFGTHMFPETYLIRDGRIVRRVVGAIDWMGDEIQSFVRAQLTDTHADDRQAYDEIYSGEPELFSTQPNQFLVRTIAGRPPGRALDVAMGQGRNALWLASHGWTVTGFDISPVAIDQARKEAANRALTIDALVTPWEDFDWGTGKWDLIVFSYFLPPAALPKAWTALKPGGLILIEGFHIETAKMRPLGGGYHDNELFQMLKDYRMLLYEDVQDRQDWGLPYGATNRLVRVLAQKAAPAMPGCTWKATEYKQGESFCWGVSRWRCDAEGWKAAGRCSTTPQRPD